MLLRRTILVLLLTIFCGVVFHAPLSVFFGTVFPEFQVEIKAWKEVLLVLAALLVMIEVTRHRMWRDLWHDWVVRIATFYAGLHVLLLPFMWQGVAPAIAGLMIDLRFILFFVLVYAMVRVYPKWRRPLLIGSITAAVISMLFAFLQVTILPHDILSHIGYSRDTIVPYLTVDQNYDYIRITGTLRGPNPLGIYAALITAGSVAALLFCQGGLRKLHRYVPLAVGALGVISAIALWFTYSRSAKIAAVCALVVVVFSRYAKYMTKGVWLACGAAALLMLGGLYAAKDTTFVSNVIFHEDPEEEGMVNSNDEHWSSLLNGTERMLRQPLGAGIGSTGSPSLLGEDGLIIENHYLYIAHETGWLGLALFMVLFVMVLLRLWRQRQDWLALTVVASGVGIAVASLFLPVWADDTVSMVWWGLAGIALATPSAQVVKKKGDG